MAPPENLLTTNRVTCINKEKIHTVRRRSFCLNFNIFVMKNLRKTVTDRWQATCNTVWTLLISNGSIFIYDTHKYETESLQNYFETAKKRMHSGISMTNFSLGDLLYNKPCRLDVGAQKRRFEINLWV